MTAPRRFLDASRDGLTVSELLFDLRELPCLPDLGLVVVGLIGECQGKDPLGNQVSPVDPRNGLRDHCLDAQVQRGKRRVLAGFENHAGRTLLPHSLSRFRKSGSRCRRVNSAIAGTFER